MWKEIVRFLVILCWPKNTNQKQTLLHIELLYSSNCDVSTVNVAVGNKITEFPFIVILQQSHHHHDGRFCCCCRRRQRIMGHLETCQNNNAIEKNEHITPEKLPIYSLCVV